MVKLYFWILIKGNKENIKMLKLALCLNHPLNTINSNILGFYIKTCDI